MAKSKTIVFKGYTSEKYAKLFWWTGEILRSELSKVKFYHDETKVKVTIKIEECK